MKPIKARLSEWWSDGKDGFWIIFLFLLVGYFIIQLVSAISNLKVNFTDNIILDSLLTAAAAAIAMVVVGKIRNKEALYTRVERRVEKNIIGKLLVNIFFKRKVLEQSLGEIIVKRPGEEVRVLALEEEIWEDGPRILYFEATSPAPLTGWLKYARKENTKSTGRSAIEYGIWVATYGKLGKRNKNHPPQK